MSGSRPGRRTRRGAPAAALLLLLCLAPGAAAAATDWTLTLGVERTRGDYGLPWQTTIDYRPVSLRLRRLPWTFAVSTSYLTLSGERTAADGARAPRDVSGVGDTVLAVRRATDLWRPRGALLDLSLELKLPTADERDGLGTGARDLTAKLDLYLPRGAWTPFFALGYRAVGDAPGRALSDRWLAGAGLAHRPARRIGVGALLEYREPSASGAAEQREALVYASWRASQRLGLMLYALTGFSDASPDRGLGLQTSLYW